MRDGTKIGESELAVLIERVDARAHELRECLGALQITRAPEGERVAVNRAIGLLERIKIQLRSRRALMNLCEERTAASTLTAAGEEPEARVKHAALALLVEAAAARGAQERVSQQTVARSVRRYRDLHIALKAAYGGRGESPEER